MPVAIIHSSWPDHARAVTYLSVRTGCIIATGSARAARAVCAEGSIGAGIKGGGTMALFVKVAGFKWFKAEPTSRYGHVAHCALPHEGMRGVVELVGKPAAPLRLNA